MADNNDGSRLLCLAGADARGVHNATLPFWRYMVERYPSLGPHHHCDPYPSTMLLPTWLASAVHKYVLGLSGAIDLRELAVEYCVLVGFVVWAAARLVRGMRVLPQAAFLGGLLVVLAEATFADYANSPYTETAALWGLAVFSVAAVAAATERPRRRAAYVIAWAAALFVVGAKVEALTLAIPLCVFFAFQKIEWRRLTGPRRARVIPALTVASLIGMAMWQGGAFGDGPADEKVNAVNELTMAVMPQSEDPGAVAAGLGLPRSLGEYSGTSFWSSHPIEQDPGFNPSRITLPRIGIYLAEHPHLSARVLASGSGPYLRHFRTDYYIGNYAKADSLGANQRADHRIAVVSWLANRFAWTGFTGVLLYWAACLAGALFLWRKNTKNSPNRAFASVALTLAASAVLQYLTAVYGEGNEVTKHLAISLFCATLTPLWIFAAGFDRRRLPAEPARAASIPAARAEQPATEAAP